MSKEKDLYNAVAARLQQITIINGYLTDIGTKLLRGQLTFDETMPPLVVMVMGDDNVIEQKGKEVRLTIPFVAEGHMAVRDLNNPDDTLIDMISDMKKAIFSGDVTFGGLVRPSGKGDGLTYKGSTIKPRDEGSNLVGAAIRFDCEIVENLGTP